MIFSLMYCCLPCFYIQTNHVSSNYAFLFCIRSMKKNQFSEVLLQKFDWLSINKILYSEKQMINYDLIYNICVNNSNWIWLLIIIILYLFNIRLCRHFFFFFFFLRLFFRSNTFYSFFLNIFNYIHQT